MLKLVGRTEELAQLDSLIARIGQSVGPSVVDVTGDAGIGKSRLLGELCAKAARGGMTVLRGRATEFERHTPFQAFTDAFADIDVHDLVKNGAGDDTAAAFTEAAPVVRGVSHTASGAPGAADRFGAYRAVARLLARLASSSGDRGLLVALDDLHWADPGSLELLDHLVRHPVSGRVLLVVARRDRQTPTSLTAALTRGIDSGVVLPMELSPLPERESLTEFAAGLPPGDAAELFAASEGNPLYLLSLLHAYRSGAPLPGAATAARHGDLVGVPSGLRALLLDELTPLSAPERRTVDTVAVLGDHATSAMLASSTGYPGRELDGFIGALMQRDLLRPAPGGRWALRHPVLRALVYGNTAAHERAGIHRRAADELARSGASAAERAHHVERSLTGWDPAAARVLTEAADQLGHTAPATAAHLLDVVLELLPDAPEHVRQRGELTLARARALGVCGHLRESRDLLHRVINSACADDPSLRADAIAQCAVMERHLGHSPEATALLRRELSRSPGPSPGQAVSLGLALGMSALLTVAYPAVRDELARTLDLARTHGDRTGEAAALALCALGEAYEGETATALRFAGEAAQLADGLTDPSLTELCESLVWLSWAETMLERYTDAERHADRGLAIARRSGQLYLLPHLLMSRAYVHLNTCRLPSALQSADEAESIARGIGDSELLTFTLSFAPLIVLAACPLGDARAMAVAEEAVATAGASDSWWASLAWCILGHTALVNGDAHRAEEAVLRAGGGTHLHRVQPSLRPAQLELLVATALAGGRLDEAESWAARATEEAGRLGLGGQRAAALRASAALAEHRGDVGTAMRLLDQAAREYTTMGAALWEAYTLLRTVALAQSSGDHAGAAAMWQRAHRLASDGGARLLVDLAEMIRPQEADGDRGQEVPPELALLTAREREIAGLVAEGLSNHAIADGLHLSRRTVETHLTAIYRKSGIPSRSALASLVTRTAVSGAARAGSA
ncbi:AAA family ATPase [Streptomyces sp. NPDC019396]|uniref:ATP-binding protein n=1 Tax=Streptomyces sp. NPDC019396 TaxID=3154687 RepID=UPI0033E127F3